MAFYRNEFIQQLQSLADTAEKGYTEPVEVKPTESLTETYNKVFNKVLREQGTLQPTDPNTWGVSAPVGPEPPAGGTVPWPAGSPPKAQFTGPDGGWSDYANILMGLMGTGWWEVWATVWNNPNTDFSQWGFSPGYNGGWFYTWGENTYSLVWSQTTGWNFE